MAYKSNSGTKDGVLLPNSRLYVPQHNYFINGGFEIWQRGASASSVGVNSYYTADRWFLESAGSANNISISQTAGQNGPIWSGGPYAGSKIALQAVLTGRNGSIWLAQYIKEPADLAALAGRTVTFAVDIYQSVASTVQLQLSTTGTGAINISPGPTAITNLWTRVSATGKIPTTATSIQCLIQFTGNGTFVLDNAVLCIGPATPAFVPLPIADDLARCQRYYEYQGAMGNASTGHAPGTSSAFINSLYSNTGTWYWTHPFATNKGGSPTLGKGTGTWGTGGGTTNQPTLGIGDTTCYFISTSGITANAIGVSQSAANAYITAEWTP